MEFTNRISIDRPSAAVIDYIADFEHTPAWNPYVLETRKVTPGPVQVGTEFAQRRSFLGRVINETFVITELVPAASVAVRSTGGPMPFTFRYEVQKQGAGTILSNAVRLDLSSVLGAADGLLTRRVRDGVAENLRRLATLLVSFGVVA